MKIVREYIVEILILIFFIIIDIVLGFSMQLRINNAVALQKTDTTVSADKQKEPDINMSNNIVQSGDNKEYAGGSITDEKINLKNSSSQPENTHNGVSNSNKKESKTKKESKSKKDKKTNSKEDKKLKNKSGEKNINKPKIKNSNNSKKNKKVIVQKKSVKKADTKKNRKLNNKKEKKKNNKKNNKKNKKDKNITKDIGSKLNLF